MAVDVGYEILIATAVSADKKTEIIGRVLQVLQIEKLSAAYADTYAAGTGSLNQASIAVGGASPNVGIRIIMDSAVVGDKKVASILQRLLTIMGIESIALTHAASYVAGTRVYNMTITVT